MKDLTCSKNWKARIKVFQFFQLHFAERYITFQFFQKKFWKHMFFQFSRFPVFPGFPAGVDTLYGKG